VTLRALGVLRSKPPIGGAKNERGRDVASCRYCSDEIFFAWHPNWLRWLPIEPESITGDEELTEDDRGVVYQPYHRRHRCQRGHEQWAENARSERERREQRESERHRVLADVVRSESWSHATLFVAQDAPPEVIRAAYKALALLYHPDLGGDLEQMVNLNRAYELLVGKN
jgi:hypothetical protein